MLLPIVPLHPLLIQPVVSLAPQVRGGPCWLIGRRGASGIPIPYHAVQPRLGVLPWRWCGSDGELRQGTVALTYDACPAAPGGGRCGPQAAVC